MSKTRKQTRRANLNRAKKQDDGLWEKLTPIHWRRDLFGEPLHYWPSTGKYYYKPEMHRSKKGCPYEFMAKKLKLTD